MDNTLNEVDSFQLFSESRIWQLNRDYYNKVGIDGWSKGLVPHQVTSNSMVGKTYAELILAFLKDLAVKGKTKETVYILELGAGHGRLAFHILKHLDRLVEHYSQALPPYCYVLSDIVEDNLTFFKNHKQLQSYFARGILDYAFYDALDGKKLHLRYSDIHIEAGSLGQPIIALANYFFDSIPNDLFYIENGEIKICSIALHSAKNPETLEIDLLIKNLQLSYESKSINDAYYTSSISNEILAEYKSQINNTYLFFPEMGIRCLDNLETLSTEGLMVLTMDKGYHKMEDIDNRNRPEIIAHGSFSLWVNYHALGNYCQKKGGQARFPAFPSSHLQLGCFMFLKETESYSSTAAAYQRYVNDFGPDDFNNIKKLAYANVTTLTLIHIITLLRLSAYDSALFMKFLPRIKQIVKEISKTDRDRIEQVLDEVWSKYFNINENQDVALSIGSIFFDLGYYQKAITFFQHSMDAYGVSPDTYYNCILCYYQLRQDALFVQSLEESKVLFPDEKIFDKLHDLDLNAV